MKKIIFTLFVLFLLPSFVTAEDTASIGQPAPGFILPDSHGAQLSLQQFKGKYVVLEWINHECPFVRKHYESGNMQKLQEKYTASGVIWLSIASSAQGKQGYMTPADAVKLSDQKKSKATSVLLDPQGKVGKLYGAKVTPHMYIIDPEGTLIYRGAIDDNSSSRQSSLSGARNYVAQALDQAMAGKPLSEAETQAYGCSIKYSN